MPGSSPGTTQLLQKSSEPSSLVSETYFPQPSNSTSKMKMFPLIQKDAFTFDRKEFMCGWGAAFVNIVITFPLNKIIFRQMLHDVGTTTAIQQLRTEGVYYLYRGMLPPLCQKTVSVAIMFGMYEHYQKMLPVFMSTNYPGMTKDIAAVLAGCTEAVLAPFERIQTLLQDKKYHNKFQNTMHACRVVRVYGVGEFYRGWSAILLRNGPSNALFFRLREEAIYRIPTWPSVWENTLRDFICGALIGGFISSFFYPLNVVKTHMQSQLGGEFQSVRKVFCDIYNERGRDWRKLYRGLHINYTRAICSWGIINAAYEILKKYI